MVRGERKTARRSDEELPGTNGAGKFAGEKAGNVPVPAVSTPIPEAVFTSANWFPAETGGRTAMIRSMPSMTGRNIFCTCMVSLSSDYPLMCLSNNTLPGQRISPLQAYAGRTPSPGPVARSYAFGR